MSKNLTAYLFDPKSPLVLRTGRPFDQAGDPVSLDFPLPSTMAGACRTAIGDEKGWDFSLKTAELKEISVYGPLAAVIEDETTSPLYPRPADALYLKEETKTAAIYRLRPESASIDEWSDLPDGLQPVFLEEKIKSKPVKGDSWWQDEHMDSWLLGKKLTGTKPDELGWAGPACEMRTHVGLNPATFAAETGDLFQTEGLSFAEKQIDTEQYQGWSKMRYGLIVHLPKHQIAETCRRVGGEGRIALLRQLENGWPTIPADLAKQLQKNNSIRLILATPALFENGWKPGWIKESLKGSPPGFPDITLRLKAFVTPRWEPVSGWNLKEQKPRAVRRMVPAGAVYWFTVEQGKEQLERLWLQPVSDLEQDRHDGYGIVLPGIWEK